MTEIEITDDFRAVCSDGLNWQIWQRKDVAVRKDGKPTGGHEMKWVPLPSYHGDLAHAVAWTLLNIPKEMSGARRSLKSFLREYGELVDRIEKVANSYAEAKMAGTDRAGLDEGEAAGEDVHPVPVPGKRGRKGKASR